MHSFLREMLRKRAFRAAGFAVTLFVLGVMGSQAFTFPVLLERQIAFVAGMNAAVEPNPLNTIAEELNNKEKELNQRELALREEEASLRLLLQEELSKERLTLALIMGVVVVILLLLIGGNYYLDYLRRDIPKKIVAQGELRTRL